MKVLLVLAVLLSLPAVSSPWWQKSKVQKKVREQRQILVVVNSGKEKRHTYTMSGIGVVRVPRSFCLKQLLKFEELQKVSKHFKKVVHQPDLQRVYLVLEAYGYQARLLMKYRTSVQKTKSVFHWTVVWGGFQGMMGSIEMTELSPAKTEMVMSSEFEDKKIPLPSIFKSFVLEMIVHRVSGKMRDYLEEGFKREGQNGKV